MGLSVLSPPRLYNVRGGCRHCECLLEYHRREEQHCEENFTVSSYPCILASRHLDDLYPVVLGSNQLCNLPSYMPR